jgi:hypothetical protein
MRLPLNDDRVVEQREDELSCWMGSIQETLETRDDHEALARKLTGDDVVNGWLKDNKLSSPTKEDWVEYLMSESDASELDQIINSEAYQRAEQERVNVLSSIGY